ncbi:MAG: DUF4065 domain-containing protein [Vampirovibrionales bacterium]|nr:DUF4065 domain-containing protein [Vampirovibrionales bacterium]
MANTSNPMPPYKALDVAKAIIQLCNENNIPCTPMKLQKLAYIAHGWSLGLGKGPLIEEPVLAWKFGPVYPEIYDKYKGSEPITPSTKPSELLKFEKTKELLDKVMARYGKYPGVALSALSHKPETPWSLVYKPFIRNIIIPNALIEKHYKEKIICE